jgi:hypothetical protein
MFYANTLELQDGVRPPLTSEALSSISTAVLMYLCIEMHVDYHLMQSG